MSKKHGRDEEDYQDCTKKRHISSKKYNDKATADLRKASRECDFETCKKAIEDGANVNDIDENGDTPLHVLGETLSDQTTSAINQDIVGLLVENNALIYLQNEDGDTPLHLAVSRKNVDIARLMLNRGANLDTTNEDGNTPLHLATEAREINIAKLLLTRKQDVNAKNEDGNTPIHLATKAGEINIIKLLIDSEADINAKNEDGNTPIHLATEAGNIDIIKLLIDSEADINAKNEDGSSAIHLATEAGNIDVIKLLICSEADVNDENACKDTPIQIAAEQGHLDVVKFLQKNGANLNSVNIERNTPVDTAAQYGHLDVVKFLLNTKIDIYTTGDNYYHRAFAIAAEHGHLDVVKLFLDMGMDPNVKGGNYRFTPFQAAALGGNINVLDLLLKRGANLNAADECGDTPLNLAISSGKINVVNLLIENGANVNALNNNGEAPLYKAHYKAFYDQKTNIVNLLIENGVNITQDMLQLLSRAKVIQPHFSAAVWCQNVRMGQINEIPSNLGEDPILLLAKIMKGRLAEEGSIETLNQILNSDNSTVRSIIETHNFVEDTTNAIIEKHAVRLYNNISFGKVYNNLGLDTILQEQQDMIVNKVKSLCAQRGIGSYENTIAALEGDNVPNLIKSELEAALKANKNALEDMESMVMGTIYKDQSITFPGVEDEFMLLLNGEKTEPSESKIQNRTLFDLKKEDLHIAGVALNLQRILDDQNAILPINIKTHLENLISDYEEFVNQKIKIDLTENTPAETPYQEMDIEYTGQNSDDLWDLP